MAASTSKRIFIYRFDRQPLEGIVNPATCFLDEQVEAITPDGNFIGVTYTELKVLCFVSDNATADLFDLHPLFERRPKSPGLWTRFTFRDGAKLDGVLSNNLLEWPAHGYFATPPYAGINRQRIFIPRLALTQAELLGVVGSSSLSANGRRKSQPSMEQQASLFD